MMPTVVGFSTPGGFISASEQMMSNEVVMANNTCERLVSEWSEQHAQTRTHKRDQH
jgi:hypothetical protein